MLDLTKKYETADGVWEVLQIEYFPEAPGLVALLKNKACGDRRIITYSEEGTVLEEFGGYYNLVPVKKTEDVWVVLDEYKDIKTFDDEDSALDWVEDYGGQYKKVTFEVGG